MAQGTSLRRSHAGEDIGYGIEDGPVVLLPVFSRLPLAQAVLHGERRILRGEVRKDRAGEFRAGMAAVELPGGLRVERGPAFHDDGERFARARFRNEPRGPRGEARRIQRIHAGEETNGVFGGDFLWRQRTGALLDARSSAPLDGGRRRSGRKVRAPAGPRGQ
jgi:hypothetical protein